jgi:hypothetical protein
MGHKQSSLKPGDPAPVSGIYEQTGPRGGHTGNTVVSEKGKPLPPTDEPGNGWVLDQSSGRK